MLRRLLIAAFAFSFIVAMGSAAFADVTPDLERQARPVPANTANVNKVIVPTWLQQPANFQRSADDAQGPVYTGLYGSPAVASPDTSACYDQDWTDYAGTLFFFTWTRPGGDTRELAMRMDIPIGHTAEVYGSYVYLFSAEAGAEVTVTLYGDAGGIPDDGNVIHTETIGPLAEDTLGGYYYVTYTGGPIVLEDMTKFHVGVKSVAAGGEAVQFGSDDGGDPTNGGTAQGTERSSYRSGGVWFNAKALFADGFDPNFIITADMCQYFSDCYSLNGLESTPGTGSVGLWIHPDPAWTSGYVMNGFAQRFTAANDTLIQVRVQHLIPAWFFGDLAGYDSSSTNGFEVNIWADDGTGNIDIGAGPLATRTIPGGLANLFPVTGNIDIGIPWELIPADFTADNLILRGPYHVSVELTTSNDADGIVLLGLNSTSANAPGEGASVNFIGGGPGWERTGQSADWLAEGGGQEQAFLVRPTLCRDEFAECQNQVLWGIQPYWVWTMCDGCTGAAWAHLVKGNPVNKLEKFRAVIADETVFGGLPGDNGAPELQMNVWSDAGLGEPGSIIYSEVISSPVYYPGWNEVVIPGGLQILGNFWIGYEGIYPDPVNDYFYAFTDIDDQAPINGGASRFNITLGVSGEWQDLDVDLGYPDNLIAEAEFCSIPVNEFTCVPGTDWAVMQHGFDRIGHSGNAMGDAYCDLSLVWSYEHPTNISAFAGPIIKDGKLVQAFGDEYKVFNLADGTEVLTLGPFGTGIFCIPAIATIDIAGTPTDVLFLAGGSTGTVHAYDWADAAAGISTPLWTFTAPGSGRAIQWGNFIVLNDGTDDVLFTAENGGRLHAIDAETGIAYAPWSGSFNFVGFGPTTSRNGTTDGVDVIYYGTNSAGFLGDLFAFDAFTKTINWQLSATAGLQGQTIYGTATSDEGFDGGIMYEAPFGSEPGKLYVNSSMTGNNPVDGIFYILEASAGSLIATKASNRMRYSTPMLDAQNVYVASFTRWVTPPAGGDLVAFAKTDASISWAYSASVAGGYSRYYNEGFVTCEPDAAPDLIFAMNESGFLSCVNAADGDEIFTRRIDYLQGNPGTSTANIGGAGAIVPDTMAFSHYYGGVSVLAKTGVDRPRLEVLSWRASQAIPFGTNPDTTVVFPDMYTNTGCADLNMILVADESQNGTTPGKVSSVGKDKAEMAAYLADQMTTKGFVNAKFTRTFDVEATQLDDPRLSSRRDVNRAATAAPPYLVVSTYNDVVAPGDTGDIEVRVDMNLLSRGQYNFYMELQNDDPDYFMNTATAGGLYPDVRLTMISGCVIDTTTLHFGAGGANHQLVTNTGRLGTGDWHPSSDGPGNFDIDGDNSSYYQGAFGYGVSMRRIAMNSQDWTTYAPGSAKDGEEGAFVSLQGDPNYVNGDCKPAISSSVAVPDVTSDGVTYTPLTASAVYSSFLDSVQVFETGGVWDWDLVADLNYDSPFDNDSTMGLYVNSRTIGVSDAPAIVSALNQATVQVMEFTERNGNTVSDWAMWHFVDYDVGTDSVAGNIANSVVWTWDVGGGSTVWGTVKIPFGPGYDPIVNNIGIVGNTTGNEQGFWAYDTYFDSSYMYAADYPSGILVRTIQDMTTQGDGEAHHSYVRDVTHDPNGTYTFGVAHFATDLAAPGNYGSPEAIELAHTVNKFAGFGRGDMNNDNNLNIADVVILANYLFHGGPGAIPFAHLADVNADGSMNLTDVNYMVDYYFNYGPAPVGDWEI